ncbi:hypothetical protein Cadr_000017098, partial [Camelus dromedarius]
ALKLTVLFPSERCTDELGHTHSVMQRQARVSPMNHFARLAHERKERTVAGEEKWVQDKLFLLLFMDET